MDTIQTFGCPCCGASLAYDGAAESLHCASCGNDFSVETLKQTDKADKDAAGGSAYDWTQYRQRSFDQAESGELCTYSCPSCAAEITGTAAMGATVCPYCGNAAVVRKKFEGAARPDYVIPFKIDKKAAVSCFENACKKAPFLPDTFKDRRKIEEMSGLYVPFWMFDCVCSAAITYRGERVSAWSDSNYNYVKTDHYKMYRNGNIDFANLPVDASRKADDTFMDSLEPYDFSAAMDFNTAYLAGYLADKYDVSVEECIPRANERVKNSTEVAFASTVTGYTGVRAESSKIGFSDSKIRYSLLPVWMLNIAYEGEMYKYAINGQTGKVVGRFPVCKKKRNVYFAKVFGIGAAVMAALAVLYLFL